MVRSSSTTASKRVSAKAVAGARVVSLHLNIDAEADRDAFFGFSLRKRELKKADGPEKAEGDRKSSFYPLGGFKSLSWGGNQPDEKLIQAFQWADYGVSPGKRYEYEVTGVFSHADREACLLIVETEPSELAKPVSRASKQAEGDAAAAVPVHDVVFNRGVAGSQAYARKFGNRAPEECDDPAAAFAWLSAGLEEALIGFVEQAAAAHADRANPVKQVALRVAAYEFKYEKFLLALKSAAEAGVDVAITYDSKGNRKGELVKNAVEADEAIEAAGLPRALLTRRTRATISHNKFIVRLEDGKPTAVWTGSTNFTAGGIFGQSNVGHVVHDPRTAGLFLDYWLALRTDPTLRSLTAVTEKLTPLPHAIAPRSTHVVFSPRSSDAALRLYAYLFACARDTVCLTAAFGVTAFFRDLLIADGDAPASLRQRFLLLEKAPSAEELAAIEADPRNRVAVGAVLSPVVSSSQSSGGQSSESEKESESEGDASSGRGEEPTPAAFSAALLGEAVTGLNDHVSFVHTKFMLVDPLGADPIVVCGSGSSFNPNLLDSIYPPPRSPFPICILQLRCFRPLLFV
jgi:PLD-like domain